MKQNSSIDPPARPITTQWILKQRPERAAVDAQQPHAFFLEPERTASGTIAEVATIFLTNAECPWHCLHCDLWKNTLSESLPPGVIPRQIDFALARLPRVPRQIKLYNSGSFFDPGAIPTADYEAVAERVCRFDRVIVECHPALLGKNVFRFRDWLEKKSAGRGASPRLEVAIGLETANPEVLARLNKQMTLDQFRRAAAFLRDHEISLRVFVLVQPPFILTDNAAVYWANRSIDFAFDGGAAIVSLIPTRGGNGALDALERTGEFVPPKISTLETALEYGIGLGRGRVFADLWDLKKFSHCAGCFESRHARMERMNLGQMILPPIQCHCRNTHRSS